MQKLLVVNFGLFLLTYLLFSPHIAYAHFPQTDGDMTVTLHVDPDDDPTPGQQANLYFLFDDITKRFALAQCNCIVSISESGKQIYKQQLIEKKDSKPSIWGAHMPYIFPSNDVYHIVLTGEPKTVSMFQPFTLSWYFRVDPADSGLVVQRPSEMPMIIGISVGGIIFLIFFGIFIKKEIIDADAVDNVKKDRYNKKKR